MLGDGSPRRKYAPRSDLLLSGVARCYCGEIIKGAGSNESGRRYRCSTGRHITRLSGPLDAHITDRILDWLPTPDAVEFVARGSESATELHAQATAIKARKKELAVMQAEGEIDRAQLRAGTERADEKLSAVNERLDALTAGSALDGLAGHADAAARWEDVTMPRRRAVVDAVLSITLNPGKRGGHGGTQFDPATVTVEWKQRPTAGE